MADLGLNNGNSVNEVSPKKVKTRSKFKLGYHLFNTFRFGEYSPHFVMESVPDDNIRLRSSHNVRSFTLSKPLMQNISLNKDYFSVPMEAILPYNWDKVFVNPNIGDDIPEGVNCCLESNKFKTRLSTILTNFFKYLTNPKWNDNTLVVDYDKCLTHYFRMIFILELFFSNGSLLSTLGCHLSPYLRLYDSSNSEFLDFDSAFEYILSNVLYQAGTPSVLRLDVGGITYHISNDISNSDFNYIDWNTAFCLMRDDFSFELKDESASPTSSVMVGAFNTVFAYLSFQFNLLDNTPFNYSRLCAYQLICAHYYSNDAVDFVYSANLYRQVMTSLCTDINGAYNLLQTYFTYNGVRTYYDALSGNFLDHALEYIGNPSYTDLILSVGNQVVLDKYFYVGNLFTYRRSLRYSDYFTGSRTRPLAVGNVNVNVSGGQVSVIDITQNIQRQRFLNAVNRSGRKFNSYLKDIFGTSPAPDFHNPFYLAHTSDIIYGQETENTGSAQLTDSQSITSVLHSNGSNYEFEFSSDRPCIVMGITSFEIPRSYGNNIERFFFHKDRYDMFNPYWQFVGDQKIYSSELTAHNYLGVFDSAFGYQTRNAEYKQRVNMLAGAFVNKLPGYAFDSMDNRFDPTTQITQSVEYIHSLPSEMDKYYVQLAGQSLANYFHFIIDNYNYVDASRPMAFNPSIL